MNHLERLGAAERAAFARRRGRPLPGRTDPVRPFLPPGGARPRLIAEFKRASPSHGPFPGAELPEAVRRYEAGGAAAISVLVAEEGFQGRLADLRAARAATGLPLLYKGFVTEIGQIDEAYAYGADAVLLIAALLGTELGRFRRHAAECGLAALCEAHDAAELTLALAGGADLVGINNRDLRSLQTDTGRFLALARRVPAGVRLVAESGYHTPDAVREAAMAGADALLIGEGLLTGGLAGNWWELVRDVG